MPVNVRSRAEGIARSETMPAPGAGGRTAHHRDVGLTVAVRVITAGPLVVLACIWATFAVLSPYFLTKDNLTNVLIQSSSVALLALGALIVVIAGALDVSLGATVGMATIVGAALFRDSPQLDWLVIPAMLGVALAAGLVNSIVIVTLRFGNPFIVTLGMLYVVQSLSAVASGGVQIAGLPGFVTAMANDRVLGVPGPVILVCVAGAAMAFLLNRVAWGRWIVATGGNPDAATKVGIPVRAVLFSVYVIASLFAGVTAILVAGLNDAGATDSGFSILLAIAAVVIGGASLAGGRGSVWKTIVGAVILGSITNGMTLLSVSPNWTPFAVGVVLVAAVGLEALRQNVEGRLRVRQAQLQGEVA
jgi:ribose/xylose/arabinose/galactoside ABC-type transport system permease subunit